MILMKPNASYPLTGTAGRDPYFGGLLAARTVADLHAAAATDRLIRQQQRLRPQVGLRWVLASGLRRVADRLAPASMATV